MKALDRSGGSVPAERTDRDLIRQIRAAEAAGRPADAREGFDHIVARHQRRASRLAFHYLRDAADADEAVQDAFVKAYLRLGTFRDDLPFEAWFTRIVINGCLDRLKARARRGRWMLALSESDTPERLRIDKARSKGPTPEERILTQEQRGRIAAAVSRLAERQRTVFLLSHYEGRTPREVSTMMGVSESTVRVHLFRAIRKLRSMLASEFSTRRAAGRTQEHLAWSEEA